VASEVGPDVRASDRRVVVRATPYNAEAPLAALDEPLTSVRDFYVRTNLGVPDVDRGAWRLALDGLVERPLVFSLAELVAMPDRTLTVTLECAGNNRSRLAPITQGEAWGPGAISTGSFRGVPLRHVLDMVGIRPGAVELRFEGSDRGVPRGETDEIAYERSLTVAEALAGDALLAYDQNGEPLTDEHGGPVRLLVPGWYGMASVKWLHRIEALDHPLEAHFQTHQYRYYRDESDGTAWAPPVAAMRVNSLITSPVSGDTIDAAMREIRGAAWAGGSPVATVEVSIDAGPWEPAELVGDPEPYAWRRWRFMWSAATAGRHSIRSRATAVDGFRQPDLPDWNRLGYGNNAIAVTLVTVCDEVG
jgi:DMSO/TMAO reductase YedYZ molybdopterin-dependent catalytic subunit